MADPRDTPAMQQHARFKAKHPECVLLFRIGDFYELFDDDAVVVSKALGLTLTQRTAGIPMCGVPHHQLEVYLKRLIAQGFRVAVCEQLMEGSAHAASGAKGIVPRAVTRVLTPGTLVDEALLDGDGANTLAAVVFTGSGDDSGASLAVAEVSTGAFVVLDCSAAGLVDELARRGVRELLYADSADGKPPNRVKRVVEGLGLAGTARPSWHFRAAEAKEALLGRFKVATLEGFGIAADDPAVAAAGALVRFLEETQTITDEAALASMGDAGGGGRATLAHLRPPRREGCGTTLEIDAVSLRALEVERTMRGVGGGRGNDHEGSLLGVFLGAAKGAGACRTAMGRRLLREWLCRPLRDVAAIGSRQDGVGALAGDRRLAAALGEVLERVQDVARIGGRVALGRATPRDLVALACSLREADGVLGVLDGCGALAWGRSAVAGVRDALAPLAEAVCAGCVEAPPAHLREGGLFRDGHDAALDSARRLQHDAGAWLAAYQGRLSEEHALPGLKVGYNRVFGYYIELPAAQARTAPAALQRKQTLKNAERYTTPELRDFETKVMSAEARALERERELFAALCGRAAALLGPISTFADAVAELDALLAFADKAARRGWVRPRLVEEPVLHIEGGRHPVLDEAREGAFVPNDVELGVGGDGAGGGGETRSPRARLALITGPNMAGKSTFIRQTALIALLAHTGSFVPAERATVGVVDRVFTRIGADDALHAGQSTFMVEMIETANILHHATARSLVVLDEIGRGTSTLDGLSLAWAIVEHLAGGSGGEDTDLRQVGGTGSVAGHGAVGRAGPRTLFATHYHELTELEGRLPGRVRNLHVAVREWPPGDPHAQIVFLHRIMPGRADHSYGLHVARLAGIPAAVVARGREVLASLSVQHAGVGAGVAPDVRGVPEPAPARGAQLGLFTEFIAHPAIDALRELKVEHLSPMQAFDALRTLKDLVASR